MQMILVLCLYGIFALLAVSPARAGVFEDFNTLVKGSYISPMDTTWHDFALHNTLCDGMKAYGGPAADQRSLRTNYGGSGGSNPPLPSDRKTEAKT